MNWDSYEFNMSGAYASAIINGDWSGLDDDDTKRLRAFIADRLPDGLVGHWDGFGEDDYQGFSRDEVSGLMADCYTARFVFRVAA